MGDPIFSLMVEKMNLATMHDGAMPDGLIGLPGWIIRLWNFSLFDGFSQQRAADARLLAQCFKRIALLLAAIRGNQTI